MTSTGFFSMDDVKAVLAAKDLITAKQLITGRVNDFVAAHSKTKSENLTKVTSVVARSRTKEQLAMAITNFMLAHPSENLKVVR